MAGHSHWAGIKHKKALVDAKRGQLWSKMSKAIIMAAKLGGGDPDVNFRLRAAIDDAKAGGVPKDNITRAIKKGTGEIAGGTIEEVVYEGYGPNGVAVLCEAYTDNRNRTAPELRKIFEVASGKLGQTGCVAWLFEKKGLFVIPADQIEEDALMEIAMEAGADDLELQGDKFQILCEVTDFQTLTEALKQAEIEPEVAELSRIPNDTVDIDLKTARKVLKLMEGLDEQDDVQKVFSNFNIPEDVMTQLEQN
jgi:YebC/PmpR family DNA-binding regulatory protein